MALRGRAHTRVSKQKVASWIEELRRSKTTPHGLPEDIIIQALQGYGDATLTWPQVSFHARRFYNYVSAHVSDCTIRRAFHRPIGVRKVPSAGVSIFRLTAVPLRQIETLFNAAIYTFVFRPSSVWFLTTNDPLCTSDHLHQRMVERAATSYRSLSEAQDYLSILWPTLYELGRQRLHQGRHANVTDFVTPWADGLMFGNMEKVDGPIHLFAPKIMDFSNSVCITRDLKDLHSSEKHRLVIVVRTFVGGEQLKETQRRLKERLDWFVARYKEVLSCLTLRSRITYVDKPYGSALVELFVKPLLGTADFPSALAELDEITSSQDWRDEVACSLENRLRRLERT
jgi:hypothetical protein